MATTSFGAASWTVDSADIAATDGTILLTSVDPNRRSVTVTNDNDSSGDLYLVPFAAQRRGGLRVVPGASVVIASVGAVYAYVPSGSARAYATSESGEVCR